MPSRLRPFNYEALTPSGLMCSGEAVGAVFPASDGMVGVLGGMAPLAALLGAGELTITSADQQQQHLYVEGGFAQVRDDVFTVLAGQCIPMDQLDPQDVHAELNAARAMPSDTPAAEAARELAIEAKRIKFRVVQHYRRSLRE